MSPPDATTVRRVGQTIRRLRGARDLSLRQLAESTGITFSQLARIERGEMQTTLDRYQAIASALKTSMRSLFPG